MISSPCKTCDKSNQPKDDCYKQCPLIQEIQEIEISTQMASLISGVDCSEENRFALHISEFGGLD